MTPNKAPATPPLGAQHYPATARNRDAILAVLQPLVPATPSAPQSSPSPATTTVLEIASGSGEHAIYFAQHLPHLHWQPSDANLEVLESIVAWTAHAGVQNVASPLHLDVQDHTWALPAQLRETPPALLVCINMIHISPWACTTSLFAKAQTHLASDGRVFLYGPFKRDGAHTSDSNAAFDDSLRARNPQWGVRDLADVADVARQHGFGLERTVAMPANNLSVVFGRNKP